MNILKKAAALSTAAVLSLVIAGCGGSAQPAEGGDVDTTAVPGIEQLANVSGAAVGFDETFTEGTVEVTLVDGEGLVVMGTLESGHVDVLINQNGTEVSTDEFYEGSGYSELGIPAGTYEVELVSTDATGSLYVLAYPANQFDVASMDTEEIIQTVLSSIA